MLYSVGSGVKRVHVVLSVLRMGLFVCVENGVVCLCPCIYFM